MLHLYVLQLHLKEDLLYFIFFCDRVKLKIWFIQYLYYMKLCFRILFILLLILPFISDTKAQTLKGMQSKMTTVTLRLRPKDDLKLKLEELVKRDGIKA